MLVQRGWHLSWQILRAQRKKHTCKSLKTGSFIQMVGNSVEKVMYGTGGKATVASRVRGTRLQLYGNFMVPPYLTRVWHQTTEFQCLSLTVCSYLDTCSNRSCSPDSKMICLMLIFETDLCAQRRHFGGSCIRCETATQILRSYDAFLEMQQ